MLIFEGRIDVLKERIVNTCGLSLNHFNNLEWVLEFPVMWVIVWWGDYHKLDSFSNEVGIIGKVI